MALRSTHSNITRKSEGRVEKTKGRCELLSCYRRKSLHYQLNTVGHPNTKGILKTRLKGKGEGYKRNPMIEQKRHISWEWGGG